MPSKQNKGKGIMPLYSCHNPIFEQIIKTLNIVVNGVKTTKFEV
jgi:hypothetical protein